MLIQISNLQLSLYHCLVSYPFILSFSLCLTLCLFLYLFVSLSSSLYQYISLTPCFSLYSSHSLLPLPAPSISLFPPLLSIYLSISVYGHDITSFVTG